MKKKKKRRKAFFLSFLCFGLHQNTLNGVFAPKPLFPFENLKIFRFSLAHLQEVWYTIITNMDEESAIVTDDKSCEASSCASAHIVADLAQ